jgi:hypothetical protein
VAGELCPRARNELVAESDVGVVGVLAQDFVSALAGCPFSVDQQVPGVVEILDQLVRGVAVASGGPIRATTSKQGTHARRGLPRHSQFRASEEARIVPTERPDRVEGSAQPATTCWQQAMSG